MHCCKVALTEPLPTHFNEPLRGRDLRFAQVSNSTLARPKSHWWQLGWELRSSIIKMWVPHTVDRRFVPDSQEMVPTSPGSLCAQADSLKALYPTSLPCLINSLCSCWLLALLLCTFVWLRVFFLFVCLFFQMFASLLNLVACICLYDAIWPFRPWCYANETIS